MSFFWKKDLHQKKIKEVLQFKSADFLQGKNVLVTGAGKNIGRSIALEMAKEGANIYFTDIDKESCCSLINELSNFPVTSKEFISDISKYEDIENLFRILEESNIIIDVLVNNAGIPLGLSSEEKFSHKKFLNVFNTNVFGPAHLSRLISKKMIKNHINGSIIFITSIHQWIVALDSIYSSSKAALGMLVKEMAVELAPYNIRVNGIAPGNVKVDYEGSTLPHKYTPLHSSSINPVYVARAAVFLSSDYFSKYTTGEIIKIDGGLSLFNHLVDKSRG